MRESLLQGVPLGSSANMEKMKLTTSYAAERSNELAPKLESSAKFA